MLMLSRRPCEALIIELPTGEQIEVAVLAVDRGQERIGTEAPEQIWGAAGGTAGQVGYVTVRLSGFSNVTSHPLQRTLPV